MKRKIITDYGVFYYEVEVVEGYDYNRIRLYAIKHLNLLLFKIPYYVEVISYETISKMESNEAYLFELKKILLEMVKTSCKKYNDDPDWDGILIKDKQKLRDILIDDVLNEEE